MTLFSAGVIVSMDHEIGSLYSALSRHLGSTLVVAAPIAAAAAVPLVLFNRRQWIRGLAIALSLGAIIFSIIFFAIAPTPSLTIKTLAVLYLRAILMLGSWLVLVSLPPALLFSRR
ncbi:MAG: hypothetical protein ACFB16_11345 [Phormidesmis sp.]